jgi:hypothetical protein
MNHVLRRMPRSAAAPGPGPRNFAFAIPVPKPAQAEAGDGRAVLVTRRVHSEAHLFTVSHRMSAEDVAELRRAVAEAAVEGRKVKVRVNHGAEPGGGGGGHPFDINIQTLVKGE